jgi:amidase
MSDSPYRGATELLDDLTNRRVSARELLDAAYARHEAVHPRINAVVAQDLERAAEEAKAIDEARARDTPLGPLAGLPMTVKDGFDLTGLPAVCGVPAMVNRPKDCPDADVVAAARQAGAVVWGKSNVPIMLGDFQTYNDVYGTTNNPYDTGRTSGGSSGGAAAALAAGITSLEIGSDIGGSLRNPANFCGVYALKTTFGQLSDRGQVPPGPGTYIQSDLGVVGPMARSVADVQLLYRVLRGSRDRSRGSSGDTYRVALWLDEPEFTLAGPVREVLESAAGALARHGVVVEVAKPPLDLARMVEVYLGLLFSINIAGVPDKVFDRLVARREEAAEAVAGGADRYSPEAFTLYATPTFREVQRLRVAREEIKNAVRDWFGQWDAIFTANAPVPAFPHDHGPSMAARTLDVDGRSVPYFRLLDWISLATLVHLPALSAPVGQTAAGLPVGVQLIGRWNEEDRLLGLAEILEAATGGFRPPPDLA